MVSSAGWHPDPLGRQRWRWFDGVEWTSRTSADLPDDAVAVADDLPFDAEDDHLTEADLLAPSEAEDPLADDLADEDFDDEDFDEEDFDDDDLEWLDDEVWPEREPEAEAAPESEPEPALLELEPALLELEPDPLLPPIEPDAPRPDAEAEVAPAHLRSPGPTPRRTLVRRRVAALVLVAALVAGAVVAVQTVLGGEDGSSLDEDHAALAYEGELLGVGGTTIRLVVDGDDLLEERQSPGRHRMSVLRGDETFDCALDAGPGVCIRSDQERAASAVRSSVLLFLDPLSPDGTFGAAGAAAEPIGERTIAGRRSTCASVRVAGRDAYEVCRDADLGFLTSAKGRDLDLRLTEIRVPKPDEVEVPSGVEVEGTTQP
jgi:hypothetical protein